MCLYPSQLASIPGTEGAHEKRHRVELPILAVHFLIRFTRRFTEVFVNHLANGLASGKSTFGLRVRTAQGTLRQRDRQSRCRS